MIKIYSTVIDNTPTAIAAYSDGVIIGKFTGDFKDPYEVADVSNVAQLASYIAALDATDVKAGHEVNRLLVTYSDGDKSKIDSCLLSSIHRAEHAAAFINNIFGGV